MERVPAVVPSAFEWHSHGTGTARPGADPFMSAASLRASVRTVGASDDLLAKRGGAEANGDRDLGSLPPCRRRRAARGWRASESVSARTYELKRSPGIGNRSSRSAQGRGSGCPALSASGPTFIGRIGAAVGCELLVWLDRPITTAVAAAPLQSYGSAVKRRLQTHRSEGRAETTAGRNREPNRGHWLAFGAQRYNYTAAFYCRGDPLPVAISQALEVGVQVRDVLPQLAAMGDMSFQIVRWGCRSRCSRSRSSLARTNR